MRKAGQNALKRGADAVEEVDFEHAVKTVRRSVSDLQKYEKLKEKLSSRI